MALELPGLKVHPFFMADATTGQAIDSMGRAQYAGYAANSDSLTGEFVVLPDEVGKSSRKWGSLWTPNEGFPPSYIAVGDIPEDQRSRDETQMGRTGFVQGKRISYEANNVNNATAFVQSYRASIFGIAASNARPRETDGDYFEDKDFIDDVDAFEKEAIGDAMGPAIAKAMTPSKEQGKAMAFKAYLAQLKALRGKLDLESEAGMKFAQFVTFFETFSKVPLLNSSVGAHWGELPFMTLGKFEPEAVGAVLMQACQAISISKRKEFLRLFLELAVGLSSRAEKFSEVVNCESLVANLVLLNCAVQFSSALKINEIESLHSGDLLELRRVVPTLNNALSFTGLGTRIDDAWSQGADAAIARIQSSAELVEGLLKDMRKSFKKSERQALANAMSVARKQSAAQLSLAAEMVLARSEDVTGEKADKAISVASMLADLSSYCDRHFFQLFSELEADPGDSVKEQAMKRKQGIGGEAAVWPHVLRSLSA
eukprot:s1004_g9.t1